MSKRPQTIMEEDFDEKKNPKAEDNGSSLYFEEKETFKIALGSSVDDGTEIIHNRVINEVLTENSDLIKKVIEVKTPNRYSRDEFYKFNQLVLSLYNEHEYDMVEIFTAILINFQTEIEELKESDKKDKNDNDGIKNILSFLSPSSKHILTKELLHKTKGKNLPENSLIRFF